jgi:phenylalanine-4-hydroxylase
MSYTKTLYQAKTVNAEGIVAYSDDEHAVWQELITRQQDIIQNRACSEFLHGLKLLDLPQDRIPQCSEVSKVLLVPALISFNRFFELLASKRFPAATFIRTRAELDYLKEPDIFHEIFGHCPLLTNPAYAHFIEIFGKLGLKASAEQRVLLARLFWFTIEFGLIQTKQGLRAYGGGILSSINETVYSLDSGIPRYKAFSVLETLQTSYQIDVIQPTYFVIDDFEQLYCLNHVDLMSLVLQVHRHHEKVPIHPC